MLLLFLGYGVIGIDNFCYVIDVLGVMVCLMGMYVDFNVVGLFFFVGMMLGLVCFMGVRCVVLMVVIGVFLVLILSCSVLFVMVVVLFVFILIYWFGFGCKVGVVVVVLIGIVLVLLIFVV